MSFRLEENDRPSPPPPGLKWREMALQQQTSKNQSNDSAATTSSPAPAVSSPSRLDKSYDSLTGVAVEDFLLREAAVQRWIEECLNQRPQPQPALYDLLSNGVVLCQLMGNLDQGSIPRIHTGKMLELGFKRRENIMYFLEALRDNKLPPGFIFHVDDLYQHQNFYRVIESLEYLSELAYKEWGAPHRRKSKHDIKKLVEQGEVVFSEGAFKRTEQVLKDYLAKKKWFLSSKTVDCTHSPFAPRQVDNKWATADDGQHQKAASNGGKRPKGSPRLGAECPDHVHDVNGRHLKNENQRRGKRESGSESDKKSESESDKKSENESEGEHSGHSRSKNNERGRDEQGDEEEEEDPFATVSKNPWKEAELEEKRRQEEIWERKRRESEARRMEEERQRLAEETRRREEQQLREEAAVLKGVIRLQAFYRGRLARTSFRAKLRAAAYRENVANEIFQTEKDYVANLGLLFDTFLHPIKEHMTGSVWHYSMASVVKQPTGILSPNAGGSRKSGEAPSITTTSHQVELKEFKDLFANILVIRNFNMKLLDDLHPRLQDWTPHQQLGDIFVQVAMFLKVYTAYVKNYDVMRRELAQAKISSPEFKQYLIECAEANRERVGKQDINSLLIQPVQRIPRYLLLLRELAKHTQPDHSDFANINTALEQIKKVAEYIEQKSAQSEMVHKMISIQSRFHGECEARSLIDPGRVFIREGQMLGWSVKNKRKQIYVVFLFNDLLVLARPMKENKNWRKTISMSSKTKMAASMAAAGAAQGEAAQDLTFCRSFQLRHLYPTALPDTKRGHCFGLVTEFDQAVAKFYTTDPAERDEWLAELTEVKKVIIKNNKARKDVIRRTLKGRKNKSVKGLSSMTKAFDSDEKIDTRPEEAQEQHQVHGSYLLLSPRERREQKEHLALSRKEKTMSVMVSPSSSSSSPSPSSGGKRNDSRRESLWEPGTIPTPLSPSPPGSSSSPSLPSLTSISATSSPTTSSNSVSPLPRSSSATSASSTSGADLLLVMKKKTPKRLASSDVLEEGQTKNGSRIRKEKKGGGGGSGESASREKRMSAEEKDGGSRWDRIMGLNNKDGNKEPERESLSTKFKMMMLEEEKDSEEWEEAGRYLHSSSSDDDEKDGGEEPRRKRSAAGREKETKEKEKEKRTKAERGERSKERSETVGDGNPGLMSLQAVGESEDEDLHGSGGKTLTPAPTAGRTRGHLSPRKALEAISSKKKSKEHEQAS